MSSRELWTALHGMLFGAAFLLAFTGGLVSLWDLRSSRLTAEGAHRAARRLAAWTWTMAILAWLTVILGTWVVYPWYRAKPPPGTADSALAHYPRSFLLSTPRTADWHEFGMEWKEHVAWFAPILATTVAFVATRYGRQLATDSALRRAVIAIYTTAFFCAMIAGILGALINKAAPIR